MVEKNKTIKRPFYKKWWFILLIITISMPIVIFEMALISVVPSIFILQIFIIIAVYMFVKSRKKQKQKQQELIYKENRLINQGYVKICRDFYINEKEYKLNIFDKIYGFSQIIDCELIEDEKILSQTIGKAKIKNIKKATTKYQTLQHETCTKLAVNITTNDFNNPRILFDCRCGKNLIKNSKAYNEALNNAQNIISTLKIIISKNNEKYIEEGAITKIEHRYITEKTPQEQIEKISELYKSGILSEYEYSIKKQELLEKLK